MPYETDHKKQKMYLDLFRSGKNSYHSLKREFLSLPITIKAMSTAISSNKFDILRSDDENERNYDDQHRPPNQQQQQPSQAQAT